VLPLFLQDYNPSAILPIQIAYYAGLRIGETCGLAWQDVNLEELEQRKFPTIIRKYPLSA
jgi:integrase